MAVVSLVVMARGTSWPRHSPRQLTISTTISRGYFGSSYPALVRCWWVQLSVVGGSSYPGPAIQLSDIGDIGSRLGVVKNLGAAVLKDWWIYSIDDIKFDEAFEFVQ